MPAFSEFLGQSDLGPREEKSGRLLMALEPEVDLPLGLHLFRPCRLGSVGFLCYLTLAPHPQELLCLCHQPSRAQATMTESKLS